MKEIKEIEVEDERYITTGEELFELYSQKCKTLRFSCDIGTRKAGIELMKLAQRFSILDRLEITDYSVKILSFLRKQNEKVRLISNIPLHVANVNKKTIDFERIRDLNIDTLNLKYERVNEKNFRTIIDNGFKCYTWGINSKTRMKRVLNLNYRDEIVEGIYSDYPDVVKRLRDEIYK